MIEITVPIRLVSEANRASHEHWRERHRRALNQRGTVFLATRIPLLPYRAMLDEPHMRLRVTMTRVAPRLLDSDNAVGACKSVRDSIADALGINDRDRRVEWHVEQDQESKTYAVRIRVEALV